MATFDELYEKYGFHETLEELMERHKNGITLHPVYHKHLPACWIIEDIYGCVDNEICSLGKGRELTAAVIEEQLKELLNEPNDPWIEYSWEKSRPPKPDRYLVQRKDGKVHFETWNGSGWAYNEKSIVYFQPIIPKQ